MGRSRRLAVDSDFIWLLRGTYTPDTQTGPDGFVDHGDQDYILLSLDGTADENLTVEPGLYNNPTTAIRAFAVWGKGLISFGVPTEAQIAFMAAATATTDLSQFPGAFIEVGYRDPTATSIYIGILNPTEVGRVNAYTTVHFDNIFVDIYGDKVVVTNGTAVIDLGTGVRLTPANAVDGAYNLASLLRLNGTTGNDVLAGASAPITIRGLDGDDTITADQGAGNLFGDGGNDTIISGIFADRLFGGDGNDRITANAGDVVNAGTGDDIIFAANGTTITGGVGTDRLVLSLGSSARPLAIALKDSPDATLGSVGVKYSGIERVDLTGGFFNDTLRGNNQANVLRGGRGADVIVGGGGSDTLEAGIGGRSPEPDVLAGGATLITAVSIDNAFSPNAGASPLASLQIEQSANVDIDQFYAFDVAEGGHLIVADNPNLPLEGSRGFTLFDSAGGFLASTNSGDPLDVDGLAAGRYVVRISNGPVFNGNTYGYINLTLSTAVVADRHNMLYGGIGNDTYLVHAADDRVIERATEGSDTVAADVSYVLPSNVEHLQLKGSAIKGTGNTLANTITGNESANQLLGGSGADTLIGGGGNDFLRGDGGADRMEGGAGNDTYRVDDAADQVTEKTGEGIDRVFSATSLTLAGNAETLILVGTQALDGTGNALANQLYGNAAANVLDGGTGKDVMIGGAGDDTYHVDSRSDRVYETVNGRGTADAGGIDLVISTVTYTFISSGREFIENLKLAGSAAISGTGNERANRIDGNNGANILIGNGGADTLVSYGGRDRLEGGAGDDVLIAGDGDDRLDPGTGKDGMSGGAGADVFVFSNAAISDAGSYLLADRINDFSHAERDRLDLRSVDADLQQFGDQAFTFIGTAAFSSKPGELRVERTTSATFVIADLDGDGLGDSFLRLAPDLTLVAGDFLL